MRKSVFKNIFIAASIILTILPGLASISSVLTRILLQLRWYSLLQETVVPWEAKMVAVLIKLVGINSFSSPGQTFALVLRQSNGQLIPIDLQWNCLGWQSMVFLIVTFVVGLRGNHTAVSKLETFIFGVAGTFLINLFRMSFIITAAFYWDRAAAMLLHDYFATFVALIWIILFWKFSYNFILEEKG